MVQYSTSDFMFLGEKLLEFQIKTTSNAVILLSPCEGCDGYEIVIGGWENTQSVIRDGKQSENHAVTEVGLLIKYKYVVKH